MYTIQRLIRLSISSTLFSLSFSRSEFVARKKCSRIRRKSVFPLSTRDDEARIQFSSRACGRLLITEGILPSLRTGNTRLESDSRGRGYRRKRQRRKRTTRMRRLRRRKRKRRRRRKVGHARWRSSRSPGKKSWTKVRLMVEKCKLSGNPWGGGGGGQVGVREGHAVAPPVGG